LHSGIPGHSNLQPRDTVGIPNTLTDQNALEVLNYLANNACRVTYLTQLPNDFNPQHKICTNENQSKKQAL
jgi:hypothetical protein